MAKEVEYCFEKTAVCAGLEKLNFMGRKGNGDRERKRLLIGLGLTPC